ncbi:Ras-related protein RABA1c [Tritrichomonas foetus]|uniref:Ras-related protein RABA1c n=1 Tax=Tritrichomonas foetus TaxID=1144522 RepID=A0A1J4JVC4_9EUKA|nr:Ras-related protein RABA1c [Tritrichomonas foetus]|eukprot:OHT02963.1 Ras-related protein RABA1c [Tritrichomonas foetus]
MTLDHDDEDVIPDYLIKVILIGDSGVGKSNLLLRWAKNEFMPDSAPTIGVEFATRTIRVERGGREKVVKVQIWDTAGQEKFRSVTSAYYRGAYGALLVYDITSTTSFQNLDSWLTEIRENNFDPSGENMSVVLVGNKSDLQDLRAVSIEEAEDFSKANNIHFLETSGKESTNVDEAFKELVEMIVDKLSKQGEDHVSDGSYNPAIGNGVSIANENERPAKKECC